MLGEQRGGVLYQKGRGGKIIMNNINIIMPEKKDNKEKSGFKALEIISIIIAILGLIIQVFKIEF